MSRIYRPLGIVAMTPKGEYDQDAYYEKLNVVTYNGSTYVAKKASNNIVPTNDEYWLLLCEKGETGETGETGPRGPKGETGNPGGTPIVVEDVSDMIDTTKIYVLSTDGHWYWYNTSNTEWSDGGAYQAAEDSETVNEMKKDYYVITSDSFTYEVGTINSNTGSNGNNSQRIRNNNFLEIDKYKLITIDNNYKLNIFAYSSADVEDYLGTTSWIESDKYYISDILDTYPTAKYIRFIFKTAIERNMSLQDVEDSEVTINELNFATKEELKETNNKIIEETHIEGESIICSFIQGSISSNNGRVDSSRNDRIVDETFYEADKIKNITFGSNYKVLLANYTSDSESSFTNVSEWQSSPISSFTSNFVRIVVKKNDESNISPSEVTNTKVNLKGTSLKEYISSIEKPIINSNQPNIIWQSRNVTDTICPPFSKDYVKLSVENEFDRIIVYVRKTTDGYYVSIHDDTINTEARNPDGTIISEPITTNNQTLATLNSYDWGIKYGSQYAGMGVPMVEDVMRWAAQYNIACTVHFGYGFSQQDAENIFNMACKYGLVDNLIILSSGGLQFERLEYFKSLNDNISYYFGCNYENLVSNINTIKSFLTGKNDVYVQPMPWGALADTSYINYAKRNNLKLYNSTVMSQNDLFNVVGFNKGYSIIETANIKNIKTTVRNHINSLNN